MADRSSLNHVMKNLNKEIEKIRGRSLKGLIKSVAQVRRDMDKTAPLVPVGETGNLRQSWFVTTSSGSIQRGKSPTFKGPNASEDASQYSAVTGSMAALAQSKGGKNKPLVICGFSANYAVYVHEMVDANFQRPGGGAKYFEASINRNERYTLKTIQREAKIK